MSSAMGTRLTALAIQAAFCGFALLCVAGLARMSPLVPPLDKLAVALGDLVASPDFYGHLGVTLYEAFTGLLIGAALGIAIGLCTGASRTATDFLNPIILSLYSVPKIIFLPILLIVFGPSLSAKIANAAIHAMFPILLNTMVGMREVDRLHLLVARSMLATRSQMVVKVYAPSMALPVLSGVRLATGLSFMGALLAELFESKAGIGYLVNQLYSKGLIAEMLSTILLMLLLILSLNALLQGLENRLTRWRRT